MDRGKDLALVRSSVESFVREVGDLVAKMNAYEGWDGEPNDDDPMMNFGGRDLYEWARSAGFDEVRMTLEVERKRVFPRDRASRGSP